MLKYCQGRASSEILSLAADISLSAKSETGLNIDAIDISSMHFSDNPIVCRLFIFSQELGWQQRTGTLAEHCRSK
jgi:hypothetical protein